MIETKIKEVNEGEKFPALYSTNDRGSIILAKRLINNKTFEGVAVHPKSAFGEYSLSWSLDKYNRMGKGSELTIKFIQE